ncbi:uncharacterized protein LOC121367578 [Gigantopelta aegis]|uniref:uncharacterized protein LOC121367578 n=1 Tax=Gigantopelta aegis TaxID=1735272 RepID=UPI001B88744C|nr:uncharacterized protein LOC121367578 [Gigantopelta aegis]
MVLSNVVPKVTTNNTCYNFVGQDGMTNSGHGMYTNNNYISVPEENYSLTPQTLSASITSSFPCLNAVPVNRFTFATPTQTSLGRYVAQPYSVTSVPSTQIANIVARTVPGLGATWQHSLPNTAHPRLQMDVTWQNCVPHMSHTQIGMDSVAAPQLSVPQDMPWMQDTPPSNKDVSVFSAVPILHPQLCYKRGPKRQLGIPDADNGCSPSKQFITEEMMAARMKDLSLDCATCTGPSPTRKTPVSPSTAITSDCQHVRTPRPVSQWQRMKEIEERLEDEEDEEIVTTLNSTSKTKPRLHLLTHDISAKDLLSTNPLLPKKIIDDLIKPTMQVVLWKPPGYLIKNTISQVVSSNDEKASLLPQVESVCNVVSESESSCDLVSDDNEMPPTDLPDLQQRLVMPGLPDENNSSFQTEEDMDL